MSLSSRAIIRGCDQMKKDYKAMSWGSFIILTGWFGMMFLLIQRAEIRRRRTVTVLMIFAGVLTFIWASGQNLTGVLVAAVITALTLNFFFWIVIGRYNPVGSSEDIRVIRMDDP
jgi:hypothetical protein